LNYVRSQRRLEATRDRAITWWRHIRATIVAHRKRQTRFTLRRPRLFGTKLAQWI